MKRCALLLSMVLALIASGCGVPTSLSKEERAFEAAYANDAGGLERLFKQGVSPNATNEVGESLLHVATGPKGGIAVVRTLLKAGADANRGQGSYTPLMNASSWVDLDSVTLLLAAGADPLLKNGDGQTALETTGQAGGRESAVKERIRLAQHSAARAVTGAPPPVPSSAH
ncbi:ankyrin repeat domain-containing protein [Roseateles sp. LYH14W]|uniref:Ankyrin repeat domain-containing protein n=1 Tax=Pelomonas parva TaxID=3299032 RepID=A0ABW7EZM4_9BURK